MVVLRPRQLAKYRRDSLTNRNTEEATDKILVGPALAWLLKYVELNSDINFINFVIYIIRTVN